MFFLSCVCSTFVSVCLYVPWSHLLGKGWHLGSRLWCPTVSLSLSHWYPGSGVVLDCIDSWSLHHYLLKVTIIRTYSRKTNKLRNINTIGRGARNISIKKWEIICFKIKIILFIINLKWNYAIYYGYCRKTARIRKRYNQVPHLSQDNKFVRLLSPLNWV